MPVERQLAGFMMILAYMYLGTATYANTESTYQGAAAVAYGASSMVGYFGFGAAPLARLTRVNGVGVLGSMAALGTILVGAGTGPLMLLMMMYMFDIFAGMTTEPAREEDDYENSSPQSTNHGPIMSFFTQSWRNNSINRKNFATC